MESAYRWDRPTRELRTDAIADYYCVSSVKVVILAGAERRLSGS